MSEQRRTEEALRQQAAMLGLAPVAIIACDLDDRVTFWNPGAEGLYGWSPDEARGQVTHDLLHTVFPNSREDVGRALLADGIWDGEVRHTTRAGAEVVVASRRAVLRDATGQPSAILEVNSDVTERATAEAALRESEERFRLLMGGVKDYAILTLSPDGRVSGWNLGAERLLGYSAEEIRGEHISRFHPPEAQQRNWPAQQLARAETAGSDQVIGWRVRRDGSRFWADSVLTALRDEHGKLRGFAKVTRDISGLKEAEDTQRRYADYQASIIKVQADIALAELDTDSLVRLVVLRVHTLTNASGVSVALLNEVQDMSVAGASVGLELDLELEGGLSALCMRTDKVLVCDDAEHDERINAAAAELAGVRSIVVAPVKDEQRIIGVLKVLSSRCNAFDELHQGTIQLLAGFLGAAIGRALTFAERMRAEKAAEAAAERFGSVLRAATECSIVGTDLRGTITVFNKGAERMLGYRADELIGQATLARLHDLTELAARAAVLSLARPEDALFTASLHGDAETREWTYIRKDGSRIPVSLTVTGMGGEDGQLDGFIGIATDIAERKAVDQLKDQFVSMVSHELRTPMNGVIAMTELLLETNLADEQREYAKTIHDSGRTLVLIVNDILDTARLQAGQVEFENIEVDIRSVVEHVVDLLVTPARRKGVELVGIVDRAVPRLLYGDPGRLRQVLTNLVSNAIKFTNHGEVSARVNVASETDGEVVLRCEIHDTGIGIESETVAHLFEPFRQADSSVTRGTGLGLAICKRLVEGLGGEISVSSQTGLGSIFTFTVRLSKPDIAASPTLPKNVRDLRVLVIDPHAIRCAALCEQLAAWEVSVEAQCQAPDPSEIGFYAKHRYDVVFVSSASRLEAEEIAGYFSTAGGHAPAVIWLNASDLPTQHAGGKVWETVLWPPRQSQLFDALAQIADQIQAGVERLAPPKRHAPGGGPATTVRDDAPLVVVVDDVEVNRRVAERMLARLGYRTQTADSGLAALEVLASTDCAAVLMDCRMPDMDGIAATIEIRRREGDRRHTPIIAMTAHAQTSDRERCLSQGMDDYMSKPVELAKVGRMLARWAPMPTPAPASTPVAVQVRVSERVLDPKALSEILSLDEPGEPSLLGQMVDAFRDSCPGYLASIRAAIEAGDHDTVQNVAHALKGASATLGAERVRSIAMDLEKHGRDLPRAGVEGRLTQLEIALEQALIALSGEVAQAAMDAAPL